MDLYAFGFNGHSQLNVGGGSAQADHPSATIDIPTPISVLHASEIKVLWLSWCDSLIAYRASVDQQPVIRYSGTGLTATQTTFLAQSQAPDLLRNLSRDATSVKFFGTATGDGLRGVVIWSPSSATATTSGLDPSPLMVQEDEEEARDSSSNTILTNKLILFSTENEIHAGIPEIQTYDLSGASDHILDVHITSNGSIHLAVKISSTTATNTTALDHAIVELKNIEDLRRRLGNATNGLIISNSDRYESIIAAFAPTQWCSNGTTSTVLDATDGTVHTFTNDPRYPKCLGRVFDPTATTTTAHRFETVPYLSETSVLTIASAGALTAAVSLDGELFIWGQSCHGCDGELTALKSRPNNDSPPHHHDDEDQDEFVKNVVIKIDGADAHVYDVAIGLGHILVAAKARTNAGLVARKVFAAGQGDRGQLGIGQTKNFVDDFTEVTELRGKKVLQMECSGWSSLVLTSSEN